MCANSRRHLSQRRQRLGGTTGQRVVLREWSDDVLKVGEPARTIIGRNLHDHSVASGLAQRPAELTKQPRFSETFGRHHAWLPFDQQPLEAQAAVEAARAAFAATQDLRWFEHAQAAWNWFFGANDRGVVLGDLATGRSRDGINPRGANENCGAESILAFQLAHYSMLALARAQQRDSSGEHGGRRSTVPE